MNDNRKVRVYYNSACPVCKAGIHYQQHKVQQCPVSWLDIHEDSEARHEFAADVEFVRKRLHVVDREGSLHVGIDAFVALWQNTPGERWKATFFQLPLIHLLAVLAYNGFAWVLYRWNRVLKHW